MSKCLVTLTLGETYKERFEKFSRASWVSYCQRHSIQLIVLDKPLDESPRAQKRSPAWQKLLILSQDWSASFDQIAWVDSDIIINSQLAPDLFSFVSPEEIGAVEAFVFPTANMFVAGLLERYETWEGQGRNFMRNTTAHQYYSNRKIRSEESGNGGLPVVQTGVVVSSPKHHRSLFESIYYNYEEHFGPEGNYEMPAMSFEISRSGYWKPLPQEFNIVVQDFLQFLIPNKNEGEGKDRRIILFSISKLFHKILISSYLQRILQMSFFLHFAGSAHLMRKLRLNQRGKSAK